MTPNTWSAAGYLVGYGVGYQTWCSPMNVAPKAPPISHSEREGWRGESSARIVARQRSVPRARARPGSQVRGARPPLITRRLEPAPPAAGRPARRGRSPLVVTEDQNILHTLWGFRRNV
jgi:hypothetical protein